MHILITGASGFLGKRVVQRLLNLGHSVSVIARNKKQSAPCSTLNVISCNITQDNVQRIVFPTNIDKVLHLAWGNLSNYNNKKHAVEYPLKHLQFLNHFIDLGVKDFTVVGTSFEYGLLEGSLSEDMICAPVTEYGKGKLQLYEDFSHICCTHDIPLKWLRLFYMYADDQDERTLWGQLNKALALKAQEFNMSQGEQQRDYLHADVVAEMIVSVSLQNEVKDIINIGSGKGTKIIDLVESFIEQHAFTMQLNRGFYPYPKHEPFAFWANTAKLERVYAIPAPKE